MDIALLIIDMQKGFEDHEYWGGKRNNPDLEANIFFLLTECRKNNIPIYHVQHCSIDSNSPLRPNQYGNDFLDSSRPIEGEPIIQKSVNSAFIGTCLESRLKESGIHRLILVGLTSNHCVSTTARMGSNLGFHIYTISDATATFARTGLNGTIYNAELIHNISLSSLNDEFGNVIDTNQVVSILKTSYGKD